MSDESKSCWAKSWRCFLDHYLIASIVAVAILGVYYSWSRPTMLDAASKDVGKELLTVGVEHTNNLVNLAMAALAATGTLAYKIAEHRKLRSMEMNRIVLAIALFGISVFFGLEANAKLIDMYCDLGTVTTSGGPYDLTNRFQFWCLLGGSFLSLVQLIGYLADKSTQSGEKGDIT